VSRAPEKLKGPKGPSSVNEFTGRLRIVEQQFNNRAEVSKAIGVAKSSYQRWVEGVSTPSFDAMAKLAKVAGVSLDWLAFGEEGQPTQERTGWYRYDPPYNYDWMWQIIDMLGDLYRMNGIEPAPDRLLHEAADIYGEAAKIADPDERSRAISMAVAIMAKVIKPAEPAEQTPTNKRRA